MNPLKKNNHRGPGLYGVDLNKGIMCLSSLFILQCPLERERLHNGLPLRAQTWPLFFSLAECFILLSPPRVSSYVVPNRTIKELFGTISCQTAMFVKQNALSCKGILNSGYIAGQAFHQRCVAELIVSACETSQAGSLNIPQKHCIDCFKYSTLNFRFKVLSFLLIQISLQLGLVTQRIFQFYNIEKLWREFRHLSKIQKSDFWFPAWSRLSKLSSRVTSCCTLNALSWKERWSVFFFTMFS